MQFCQSTSACGAARVLRACLLITARSRSLQQGGLLAIVRSGKAPADSLSMILALAKTDARSSRGHHAETACPYEAKANACSIKPNRQAVDRRSMNVQMQTCLLPVEACLGTKLGIMATGSRDTPKIITSEANSALEPRDNALPLSGVSAPSPPRRTIAVERRPAQAPPVRGAKGSFPATKSRKWSRIGR